MRVLDENETSEIDTARSKALAQALPIITSVKATGAVDVLAYQPFTQLGFQNRRKVRFARYYDSSGRPETYEFHSTWEIEVKDVALPAPADCTDLDIATPVGLEVTVKEVKSGKSISAARNHRFRNRASAPTPMISKRCLRPVATARRKKLSWRSSVSTAGASKVQTAASLPCHSSRRNLTNKKGRPAFAERPVNLCAWISAGAGWQRQQQRSGLPEPGH